MKSRSVDSRTLGLLLGLLLIALFSPRCGSVHTPRNEWNESWGPLVPHTKFPADCSLCHVPDRWDVIKEGFSFDHAKETGHALEGAHKEAACLRCHNDYGPVRQFAARGCYGCHEDIHQARLGNECSRCHNQHNWNPGGLVAEHARTRFPLYGVHVTLACEQCHTRAPTGDFSGAPVQCEVCHRDDLARATTIDHAAQGWTNSCERCHLATSWGGAGFSHSFFPVTGGHAPVSCEECHPGGRFAGTPRDCYSCHRDDYEGQPDHVAGNFPTSCENCHSVAGWEGAHFSHTFFPLNGGHAGLDCSACHAGNVFQGTPSDCNSCHNDDYQAQPTHTSSGYPTDCERCHNTTTWTGAFLNHTFPLRGDHNESCTTCHPGGNTAQFTCLVCHDHSRERMDDKHSEERDYVYASASCLDCHPQGGDD